MVLSIGRSGVDVAQRWCSCIRTRAYWPHAALLARCNQVSVDTRNAQPASGQRIRARSDSSQETTWDLL